MDPESTTPTEEVYEVRKALSKTPAGPSSANYQTMARFQSDSQALARTSEAARVKAPGGFRRHYLHGQAEAAGVPLQDRPASWRRSFLEGLKSQAATLHEAPLGVLLDASTGEEVSLPQGTGGTLQASLAIVKAFVGSGITFLPDAFSKGGWLLGGVVLLAIGVVNIMCVHLLLECRARTGCPSFGEIAMMAMGPKGKLLVQVSIVFSQFACIIAYIIFMSTLLGSVPFVALTPSAIIFLLLIPLIPLCWIRSVDHLEYPNLVANVLIMFGLGVTLVASVILIATSADPGVNVVPFNRSTCGIFIGMGIFTFEGIATILPIQSSMKEPDSFWSVFSKTFVGVILIYLLFGILGYLAWGDGVQTVIFLNLNQASPLTCSVKVGYMIALILSVPLVFLPAARITELWIFGVMKEASLTWEKNALRAVEVVGLAIVAVKCQFFFSRFISFVGALCGAPIAFVYPALFHLLLCASTTAERALDVSVLVFGISAVGVALHGSVAPSA